MKSLRATPLKGQMELTPQRLELECFACQRYARDMRE